MDDFVTALLLIGCGSGGDASHRLHVWVTELTPSQSYASSSSRLAFVRAVYDSEAVKTVGLVNRLIAEKANPQCDLFWNNEEFGLHLPLPWCAG